MKLHLENYNKDKNNGNSFECKFLYLVNVALIVCCDVKDTGGGCGLAHKRNGMAMR